MNRVYSDEVPVICRLQGVILYPHDVQEVVMDGDEKRTQYSYIILRVPDRGQQIEEAAEFKKANYVDLRRALYPPIPEQLDMQYHGTWGGVIDAIKKEFAKPVE